MKRRVLVGSHALLAGLAISMSGCGGGGDTGVPSDLTPGVNTDQLRSAELTPITPPGSNKSSTPPKTETPAPAPKN
jgi:hypothetical protein